MTSRTESRRLGDALVGIAAFLFLLAAYIASTYLP